MKAKHLAVEIAFLALLAAGLAPRAWALGIDAGTGPAPGPKPVLAPGPKGEKTEDPKEEVKEPPRKLDDPAKLMEKLLNGDFEERQQAAADLQAHGEAAREVLEKAVKETEDLEVKETAARLLAQLTRSTIKMEVIDRKGNPVQGAEGDFNCYDYSGNMMAFNGVQQRQQRQVTTDAEGKSTMDGLRPGAVQVNINWKNVFHVPSFRHYYNLTLHKGENRMQFVMTKGGKVKATVVSAETGKPVEGASIAILPDQGFDYENLDLDMIMQQNGWMQSNMNGTTDAKGMATVEKVAQGTYVAVVRHEDHLPGVLRDVSVRDGVETAIEAPFKLVAKAASLGTIKVKIMDGDKPLKKGKAIVEARRNTESKDAETSRQMMQMRWQWGMQQEQAEQETDEEGIIELKDKRPGKYRITVARQGLTPAVVKDVEVVAGKPVTVEVAKPGPGAKIAGKILNPAGKGQAGTQVLAIPVEEMEESAGNGEGLQQYQNMFWYRRQRFGGRNTDYAATNAEGRFEIKGLPPGEYALVAMLPQNRLALVWGVKAEDGKTADAPEVKIPGAELPEGAKTGGAIKINGIVLMPDGRPAESGQITMHYRYMSGMGSGSWGNNIGKDGKFNFARTWGNDDMRDMEPFRLSIQLPGCRPKTMDLTKEGLNLENVEVRMEKQSYGQARVTVTDLEGKPQRGARVSPVANANRARYYGRAQAAPRAKSTNDKGEAYFTGLAAGKRTFSVDIEGYFIDEPAELEIPADAEAKLTVKMQPTLTIKGKAELPTGFDLAKVVLCLQAMESDNQTVRTTGLDAEGRFGFDGLPPGKYQIFTNHPKLAMASQANITLDDKSADVAVKLAPAGGAKLDFGAAYKRTNLALSEAGKWDPSLKKDGQEVYGGPTWAAMDGAGVAELFGIVPGTYDAVVNPPVRYNAYQARTSKARLVVKGVQIAALPGGYEDLEKAARSALKLPEGDGRISGTVSLKGDWKGLDNNNNNSFGNLTVHVVGTNALGAATFNLPQDLSSKHDPVIVGKPPEKLLPGKTNAFSVESLPPGEYRIYTEVSTYNRYGRRSKLLRAGMGGGKETGKPKDEPAPVLVKTVTVEAGKPLDLGQIEFEIPAELKEKVAQELEKQFEMNYGAEIGEDEPEVVKP